MQDFDVIEVIFKHLNTQKKRNIILSEDIVDKYGCFIHHGEWDSIDLFIKYIFFDEDIN